MSALLDLGERGLFAVKRTDLGARLLADRHYSRQTPGAREFMGNGRTLVLRDTAGLVVFGWLYPKTGLHVLEGVCCSIFRNEGMRRSSDVILEAEEHALQEWGDVARFYTYVKPDAIASPNPGYCFKVAGYRHVGESSRGLHLLVKERPTLTCGGVAER